MKDTNMVFFAINKSTLTRWYKNTIRRNEIEQQLQGISLPGNEVFGASETLPPPQKRPHSPGPPPDDPHEFPEPKDTTGQAQLGGELAVPAPFISVADWLSATAGPFSVAVEPSLASLSPSGPSLAGPSPHVFQDHFLQEHHQFLVQLRDIDLHSAIYSLL